jgi:hypothetical protein
MSFKSAISSILVLTHTVIIFFLWTTTSTLVKIPSVETQSGILTSVEVSV